MCPVRYELGFCIPKDYILHNHRRVNLKSYSIVVVRVSLKFELFLCVGEKPAIIPGRT
jgi:hypothetical protein